MKYIPSPQTTWLMLTLLYTKREKDPVLLKNNILWIFTIYVTILHNALEPKSNVDNNVISMSPYD